MSKTFFFYLYIILILQVKYFHVACTSWDKLKWNIQALYNTFRSCRNSTLKKQVSYRCTGKFLLNINSKKRLKIPKSNPNSKIIEEGQTTQRGQEDRQWSTKDTHKAKDRVTRIPHSQVLLPFLHLDGKSNELCSINQLIPIQKYTKFGK
jgi:predicted patatin/cPLA2 family phospholipase